MRVEFDDLVAAVTITVEGTEWPSTVNRVVVERSTGQAWERIRGGDLAVIAGFLRISDIEMPLHMSVDYRVHGYNGTTAVATLSGSVSTQLRECRTYIKAPSRPNDTIATQVPRDTYEQSSETAGGVYEVLGGDAVAVAAWSGTRATRFQFLARTTDDVSTRGLDKLMRENRVVLVQPCVHEPYPAGWYYVESVAKAMRASGQVNVGRDWTMPLVSCGVPSGDTAGVAGSSYAMQAARYLTYGDMTATETSYFDLLQGS